MAATSDSLSENRTPPARAGRWVALAGFLLALGAFLSTSLHTWTLTAVAPLGWRLRVLLPDALVTVPCLIGFALAASSAVPWRRRVGWGIVAVTVVTAMIVFSRWSDLPA